MKWQQLFLMTTAFLLIALPPALGYGASSAQALNPAPLTSAPAPTATLLAKAALVGIKVNVRERRAKGQIASLTVACIEDLDESALIPVYQSSLEREWGPQLLAESDTFLATPLGEKIARISMVEVYAALKHTTPEPAPVLTFQEEAEWAKFLDTPAGRKLVSKKSLSTFESRQSHRNAIIALSQSCGLE